MEVMSDTYIEPWQLFIFSLLFTFNLFWEKFVSVQISSRMPLKIDVAFLSGVGSENSRIEERISSLTGVSIFPRSNEYTKPQLSCRFM